MYIFKVKIVNYQPYPQLLQGRVAMLSVLEGESRQLLQLSCLRQCFLQHLQDSAQAGALACLTGMIQKGMNFLRNLISCGYEFVHNTQV